MTWDHLKAAYKAADGLDIHSRTVLLDLAKLADGRGRCFPSQQWLARHPGLGVTKVKEALNALVELGLVSKEAGHRQEGQKWAPNLYVIHLPAVAATRPRQGSDRSRDVATAPKPPRDYKYNSTSKGGDRSQQDSRRAEDEGNDNASPDGPASPGPRLTLHRGGKAA